MRSSVRLTVNRQRWPAAILLLAALFLLNSCSRRNAGWTVALITPLTTFELWKSLHAGVVRASGEHGFRWYWNAPTHESDPERQLDLLDHQLNLGVAGVVLTPVHSSVLIRALTESHEKKIPLVIAGESLAVPLDERTGSVVTDQRKVGVLAAALTQRVLHGRGKIVIVGLSRSSTQVMERTASYQDAVHAAGSIRITLKLDDMVGPGGASHADLLQVLQHNSDVRLIFAASLAATRAAYATLQESGLSGRIALIGYDQDPELYGAVRSGEILGLVAENMYQIGYQSAEMLIAVREGKGSLRHVTLEPLLLDRNNLDDPATQKFLHPYTGFDR